MTGNFRIRRIEEERSYDFDTKEAASILQPEIDNWRRYGKDKSFYPKSFTCLLGKAIKTLEKGIIETAVTPYLPPVNVRQAEEFEDLITRLPIQRRMAFLLYAQGKAAAPDSHFVWAKNSSGAARVLRISVRQYHYRVRYAVNLLLRWLIQLEMAKRYPLTQDAVSGYSVPALEKDSAGFSSLVCTGGEPP